MLDGTSMGETMRRGKAIGPEVHLLVAVAAWSTDAALKYIVHIQ